MFFGHPVSSTSGKHKHSASHLLGTKQSKTPLPRDLVVVVGIETSLVADVDGLLAPDPHLGLVLGDGLAGRNEAVGGTPERIG